MGFSDIIVVVLLMEEVAVDAAGSLLKLDNILDDVNCFQALVVGSLFKTGRETTDAGCHRFA